METAKAKYDSRPLPGLSTGLEFRKDDTNRKRLYEAWRAAGLNPRYPMDTRGVLALVRILGYEATKDTLSYHLKRGYFASPPKLGRDFAWDETSIVAFADSLESTRNWLPLSPIHVHKLTPQERAKHQLEFARLKSLASSYTAMSCDEIINLLVTTDGDIQLREMMAYALKAKLGSIHLRGAEDVPEGRPADPAEVN